MNGDTRQHEAKQGFQPYPRCPGSGLRTYNRSAGAAHGKTINLVPFDVAFLKMDQGTADCGKKDNGKAGAESGVNDDFVLKADSFENHQEKRDINDAAAQTEQTGEKTGKGTE